MERLLGQAGEMGKNCDWLGAIECYRRALAQTAENGPLRDAKICELLGQAYFRAAMQAGSVSDFRARCAEAVKCYEEAEALYSGLGLRLAMGKSLRCRAIVSYLSHWLSSEVDEKRNLVALGWKLAKESLETFAELDEGSEFGRAYNQLSIIAGFSYVSQISQDVREMIVRDAVNYGEKAIVFLSNSGEAGELAAAYAKTALFLGCLGMFFVDLDEREVCDRKAMRYWSKATEICEEGALSALLSFVSDMPPTFWGVGTEEALGSLRKGLDYARRTRDRLSIGWALDCLAFDLSWRGATCENAEEGLRLFSEALRSAHDARSQYKPLSFTSCRGFSFSIELADALYKHHLSAFEPSINKRRDLIEQAERYAREGFERCEQAGYPLSCLMTRHELSRVLLSLARVEKSRDKRRRLLEEAITLRVQVVEGFERFLPFHYFDQGFVIGFLASTKCELAEEMESAETRQRLLEEAVTVMEKSIKLGAKYIPFYEKKGSVPLIVDFYRQQFEYGDLLGRVYSLNKDNGYLRRQIDVLQEAAAGFRKLNLVSRAAECFWKIAQAYEILGEELEAARDFESASRYYEKAARKIPQVKDFYQEKALFLRAWSDIARAKHFHQWQNYAQSRKLFRKVAGVFKTFKQWQYLSRNYSALAAVDGGEDLSRKELCGEAIEAFEQGAGLFEETKKLVQKEIRHIEYEDEKQMAVDLLTASDMRSRYCRARISVENAKILGMKGENYASAKEYGSAADAFEAIALASKLEEDQKELRFIAVLSSAWQRMVLAGERDMPELYAEAAQLFERACALSNGDRGRFLALGHSQFCKALESGTRFLGLQEMGAYSSAMQCLQSAARYYEKAGLKMDLEHAKATELFFEACAYVNNAKREVDPEKKTRLYRMAELSLQASSERFIKAKRPEKNGQVLRMLKTVQEEREWTLYCSQVLKTAPLVSAAYLPVPMPTTERAVGLNGFDHAHIQVYISSPKEAVIGEEITFRLDLFNVAAKFGLLVRIENLIPSGLKFVSSEPSLMVEEGSVDFRGRRLEPMKMESVKISVVATQVGVMALSPRVVFVDDVGRFRVCKPRAVRLAVNLQRLFDFRAKSAENAFSFLVSSFVEDREKRRMPLEHCGWRSLGDVMKHGGVSRSSVYRASGGRGEAIADLERLGLIETRTFSGERGRGGNIRKVRICYAREDVKKYMSENKHIVNEKGTRLESDRLLSTNKD